VSCGAEVGAAAVIASGLFAGAGVWALSGGAMAGAFAAAALVFLIAAAQGGLTPLRLGSRIGRRTGSPVTSGSERCRHWLTSWIAPLWWRCTIFRRPIGIAIEFCCCTRAVPTRSNHRQ
jgi:hypothetical protein